VPYTATHHTDWRLFQQDMSSTACHILVHGPSLHVDSRSGGTACIPSLGFRPSEGIHTHSTSLNLLASQPLLTVPARHQPVWCTFPT
jgi:hypothetical protein